MDQARSFESEAATCFIRMLSKEMEGTDLQHQAHVLLFGALAERYGFDMLNCELDRPNMEETVRLIVSIIKKHFFETTG
jgi:hypothetical protein